MDALSDDISNNSDEERLSVFDSNTTAHVKYFQNQLIIEKSLTSDIAGELFAEYFEIGRFTPDSDFRGIAIIFNTVDDLIHKINEERYERAMVEYFTLDDLLVYYPDSKAVIQCSYNSRGICVIIASTIPRTLLVEEGRSTILVHSYTYIPIR